MPPRNARANSETPALDFSDDEDSPGTSNKGSKGKGKKSVDGKSEDQRKMQNRLAQREFRQRKQEYIKTLEAKVKMHESSRDDQLDTLQQALETLLEENQKLRELLAGVSGFIGEGIGGHLPRLKISFPDFHEFVNRKPMTKLHELAQSVYPSLAHASVPAKRQRMADVSDSPNGGNIQVAESAETQSPVCTAPHGVSRQSSNTYELPPVRQPTVSFSPTTSVSAYSTESQAPVATTPNSHMSSLLPPRPTAALPYSNMRDSPGEPRHALPSAAGATPLQQNSEWRKAMAPVTDRLLAIGDLDTKAQDMTIQELFLTPTDNPQLQAIQLVSYHMRNRRENPNYHLPPSLEFTVTQRSMPHSPVFDGIIFPTLRDRLILMKDQYNINALLQDLVSAFNLHGDDVLIPANWELNEPFLRKYWYIIDREVLAISNRWRQERGESELTMRQLIPDGNDMSAEGVLGARSSK